MGPNPAAVRGMLETVGFRTVKVVDRDSTVRCVGRAIKHKIKDRSFALLPGIQQGRAVFHAWK